MKNKNDLFFWGAHVHNEFPEMYFTSELKQEKSSCKTHDLYLSFTIVCYIKKIKMILLHFLRCCLVRPKML